MTKIKTHDEIIYLNTNNISHIRPAAIKGGFLPLIETKDFKHILLDLPDLPFSTEVECVNKIKEYLDNGGEV